MHSAISLHCADPEPTPESLHVLRVTLRQLLLSHPDPQSFSRAQKIREESSGFFLLLDPGLLKALLKERLIKLHQLHRHAQQVTKQGNGPQLDLDWSAVLDTLCELDVLAWALSAVLEESR